MSILIGFLSCLFGVFGFCQIIGSIRARHLYPPASTAATIIIWSVLLILAGVAVHAWLPDYTVGYYIGTAISFIISIAQKKIE